MKIISDRINGKKVPLRGLILTKEGKGRFDAKGGLHNGRLHGWFKQA